VRYRLRGDSICGRQSARAYTSQIVGPLVRNPDIFQRQLGLSISWFHCVIARSYTSFARKWLAKSDYRAALWALLAAAREMKEAVRAGR
jgi:hypothetical protein